MKKSFSRPVFRSAPAEAAGHLRARGAAGSRASPPPFALVFFDGLCPLCDFFVHFILKRDKGRIFRFAPLQGVSAARLLEEKDRQSLKYIVLLHKGRILKGFAAVQEIFCLLYPRMSWILKKIPGKWLYAALAFSRYSLFGKRKALSRPDAKHNSLFLD